MHTVSYWIVNLNLKPYHDHLELICPLTGVYYRTSTLIPSLSRSWLESPFTSPLPVPASSWSTEIANEHLRGTHLTQLCSPMLIVQNDVEPQGPTVRKVARNHSILDRYRWCVIHRRKMNVMCPQTLLGSISIIAHQRSTDWRWKLT